MKLDWQVSGSAVGGLAAECRLPLKLYILGDDTLIFTAYTMAGIYTLNCLG